MKGPLLFSRKGDNFLWDLLIRERLPSSTRRTMSDFWKIWHKNRKLLVTVWKELRWNSM